MHKENTNYSTSQSVEFCSFKAFSYTLFHFTTMPKVVMEVRVGQEGKNSW